MYAGRIERLISRYSPIPMCAINMQGKVTRASGTIAEVFKYDGIIDGDIFALTGLKLTVIADAVREHMPLYIERNDRKFKLLGEFLGEDRQIRPGMGDQSRSGDHKVQGSSLQLHHGPGLL